MLLLRCCLDMLPKKYRFTSQPVGGDDNNNKGATHGGQRMSSGSGGGGGRDLIPVWCGSVVCGSVVWCVAVWYEQEVGGRLSSTCAPPPREHRPAFQSSVGQQLVSRSEAGFVRDEKVEVRSCQHEVEPPPAARRRGAGRRGGRGRGLGVRGRGGHQGEGGEG